MEDKRQRARVQGGWASQGSSRMTPCTAFRDSSARNQAFANSAPSRFQREAELSSKRQFVFKAPEEVVCKVPEPRLIEKQGLYEISTLPSGVSKIHLIPGFVSLSEADWMFDQLFHEIPWRQRTHVRHDRSYDEPRLTAWYGKLPYTYSRLEMQANPDWHPLLAMLKDLVEDFTKNTFNSLLCNLYRNEKDSVDWHSDDEPTLGKNPIIASLSFGATRMFEMRKKPLPEDNSDYTYVQRVQIPLDHGTLLMMEGATQEDWQHRVPKEYHSREPRINLTFRTMYPEPEAMHT
ncbi:alpha-ketoglutarate-dependent dioxygenase alkB homolog 3 [Candoia aspera]|uniref:alpha-ketoglutarate-dependent dioxygenase alkB homolog 3 n=1 Tax=Candoia aspera TaxID=51853 RepID=UPI002FD86391